MKRLLVVIMFLTSAFALAFDGLLAFDFRVPNDSEPTYEPAISLSLVVMNEPPAGSPVFIVSLVCGSGIRTLAHNADAWTEWVERFQPVITPNSISFAGFTFGCDPDWYFVEAPSTEELLSAFYRQGPWASRWDPVALWGYGTNSRYTFVQPLLGLPAPSLVVNTVRPDPNDPLSYGIGVVLPLRSPLTPVVYDIPAVGQARPSRASAAGALNAVLIGVRQGSQNLPLVFDYRVRSAPSIDTSRPFELLVATPHIEYEALVSWEHLLIDTSNARLAYRFSTEEISLDPVPETTLADLAARFDAAAASPAGPQPETPAEVVEPEPEPEIELVEVQVQAGENLWVIAERHGVTVDEIVRINCLPDPYVNPGTRIKIPPTDQEIAPRCG